MHSTDRLHALDAVRAFALLLGIALHAAQPFVAGLPWVTTEPPSDALATVFFTIHMFRMPLFFLIAGFFGRMLLERRGTAAFVKDRSRRILMPLAAGLPIVMLLTGAAYVLGSYLAGGSPSGAALEPPPSPPGQSLVERIHLIHLWFLYYLLIFYGGALGARALLRRSARFNNAVDTAVSALVRSFTAPLILGLPIALYYFRLQGWSSWGGFPAPFSLIPDAGALLAYGTFFAFGWMLHRQRALLSTLERHWPVYAALAVAAWAVCRAIGGAAPHWGPYLAQLDLFAYTASYMIGAWCWSFALLGAALRFLSGESAVRRYLADASYWMYLMHIAALLLFAPLLKEQAWHWTLKYSLSIAGAVAILLVSYHYLVRFTFVGAILNGRRQTRVRYGGQVASGAS